MDKNKNTPEISSTSVKKEAGTETDKILTPKLAPEAVKPPLQPPKPIKAVPTNFDLWKALKTDLGDKWEKLQGERESLEKKAYREINGMITSARGFWNNILNIQHLAYKDIIERLEAGTISPENAAKAIEANRLSVEKILLTIPRYAANHVVAASVNMGQHILGSIFNVLLGNK